MVEESQRPSVAANIAGSQIQAGDISGALLTIQALASHGDPGLAIDTVSAALAVSNNQELALKLVDTSPNENIRAASYLQMALALAQKGKFDLAVETARRIPDSQISVWVDACMRIYEMEFKAGKGEAAAQLLQSVVTKVEATQENSALLPVVREELLLTVVMHVEEAGNRDAAWPLVEKIRAIAENEPDPTQHEYLLRDLAYAETHLGNYAAALETIDRLPAGPNRDGALEVFAMIRTQKGDPEAALDQLSNISQDFLRLATLRSAADARALSGNYAGALAVIDSIPGPADRAYALAELAIEQAQQEDPTAAYTNELAWETARDNREQTAPYVFQYIAVTKGLLGDFGGALAVLQDLGNEWKPWVLWNLTSFMVQSGEREQAYVLADEQTQPYPKAYALLGLAQGTLQQLQSGEAQTASTP